MRTIVLHAPAIRNDRTFADAGESVIVGAEPDQISASEAASLVKRKKAIVTRLQAA